MPPNNVSVSAAATPLPLLAGEQVIFLTRPSFVVTFIFIGILWLVGAAFIYLLKV